MQHVNSLQLHKKSMRGEAELYSETKRCFSVALTPTGAQKLDLLAQSFNLSRSELVERIARGLFGLVRCGPQTDS